MKYLVIRHAETDGTRMDRADWGPDGAPLNTQGKVTASRVKDLLFDRGIDPGVTEVAVSELIRTRQTAQLAGFPAENIHINPLLNEINTENPTRTQWLVEHSKLPTEAIIAAWAILENPPAEPVWVTHGLVIAGLREVLELEGFVPNLGDIAEIEL